MDVSKAFNIIHLQQIALKIAKLLNSILFLNYQFFCKQNLKKARENFKNQEVNGFS